MSAIYNEYLTGVEREEAIAEATLENELSKLFTMFEMTTLKLEQMKRDAELKVFSESGTYDDLVYLMQEAEGEVAEQRKGILTKIFEAIQSMINWILDKLNKNKNQGKPDDIMEFDSSADEAHGLIAKAWKRLAAPINNIKNGEILKGIGGVLIEFGAVAGLAKGIETGVKYTGKKIQMKRSEVNSKETFLSNVIMTISGAIDKIRNGIGSLFSKNTKDQEDCNTVVSKLEGFIAYIKEIVKGFGEAVVAVKDKAVEVAGNIKDGVVNGAKAVANAFTGNKDEQQPQQNNNEPIMKEHRDKDVEEHVIAGLTFRFNTKTDATTYIDKNGNEQRYTGGNPTVDKMIAGIKNGSHNQVKENKTANIKKTINGIDYDIDRTTRKTTFLDKNGNVQNYRGGVPKIDKILRQLKNGTYKESLDIMLDGLDDSDMYTVEMVNDDIIITKLEELHMESTSMSIFGYDVTNESAIEEADFFEKEMEELSDIFEDL